MEKDDMGDPLTNDVILKNIFKFVDSVEDLKSARLVSKTWRDASLTKWRSTAVVRVLIKKIVDPTSRDGFRLLDGFSEFADLVLSNVWKLQDVPFAQFRVCNFHLRNPVEEHVLWDICGPHMKYLNLENSRQSKRGCFPTIKWILCEKCRGLEELRLTTKTYKCKDQGCNCAEGADMIVTNTELFPVNVAAQFTSLCLRKTEFIEDLSHEHANVLRQIVPKLKNLKVSPSASDFLQVLKIFADPPQQIQLRGLVIDKTLNGERLECYKVNYYFPIVLEYFNQVGTCLDVFELPSPVHIDRVGEIIYRWNSTLKRLRLEAKAFPACLDFGLVDFPCLTNLFLAGNVELNLRCVVKMPNLEYLHFHPDTTPKFVLDGDEELIVGDINVLDKLRFLHLYCRISYPDFKVLASVMPNVNVLEVALDAAPITSSFADLLWPELKELSGLNFLPYGSKVVLYNRKNSEKPTYRTALLKGLNGENN